MDNTTTETKECSICENGKPLTEYYKQNKTKKDGTKWTYYNPECKECTKKRAKDFQQKHLDKKKQFQSKYKKTKKYKLNNKQYNKTSREKGTYKEWYTNNPDKIRKYNKYRMMNKKHEINKYEWESCKKYFNFECAYCGMSEEEHRKLYKQDLHKEHVNSNGANDLSNCIPACRICNPSKGQYTLEQWFNEENDNYSKERLEKINKWLNEHYKLYIKNN